MPAFTPFLTESLPIRRLGIVTQATATFWCDDRDPAQAHLPKGRLVPVTFPVQIPLGNGWRLQHASPTTGQLVTQNSLLKLFHGLESYNIRLSTFSLYNVGLLESFATSFTSRPIGGLVSGIARGHRWQHHVTGRLA